MALEIHGRALVDIPALGLKCGEYTMLPAEIAKAYEAICSFDPKAKHEMSAFEKIDAVVENLKEAIAADIPVNGPKPLTNKRGRQPK